MGKLWSKLKQLGKYGPAFALGIVFANVVGIDKHTQYPEWVSILLWCIAGIFIAMAIIGMIYLALTAKQFRREAKKNNEHT